MSALFYVRYPYEQIAVRYKSDGISKKANFNIVNLKCEQCLAEETRKLMIF